MNDNLKRKIDSLATNKGNEFLTQLDATYEVSDKLDLLTQAIKEIPQTVIPETVIPEQKDVVFPDVQKVEITNLPDEKDNKEELALLKEIASELKKKEQLAYDIEIDSTLKEQLRGNPGELGKPGKDGKDGTEITANEVALKLESLEGEDRLDVSAVKGTEELIDDMVKSAIKKIPKPVVYMGGRGSSSSSSGSSTFIGLTDVPATYTGQASKGVRVNAGETALEFFTLGGGTGTVTDVSVITANGVSGSVATSTTTPAITLTLGAITPSSVASTGTVTGTNLSGTNTGDNAINSLYSGLVSNANHTGDATGSTALTLATVNSNVGSFGLAGSVSQFTVNAKGLITAAANVAISITSSAVSDFASTVRGTVLTGLSLVSTTVISATDTVLVALGSLQAQITALTTTVSGKASTSTTISTTAPLSGGGDLSTNRTLTTSMATNKLIGRGTAGTGVFEEITLGTNLSLTGTTLNATGGGGSTITTQDEGGTLSSTVTTLNFTGAGVTASGAGATTTINIPGGSGSFAVTETEIDFGTKPIKSKRFTITDAAITATSKIMVTPSGSVATDRVGNDWEWDAINFSALSGTGQFTLTGTSNTKIGGKRKVYYTYS